MYDFLEEGNKHKTWTLMKHLHLSYSLPWLCAGGFNNILFDSGKKRRVTLNLIMLSNYLETQLLYVTIKTWGTKAMITRG